MVRSIVAVLFCVWAPAWALGPEVEARVARALAGSPVAAAPVQAVAAPVASAAPAAAAQAPGRQVRVVVELSGFCDGRALAVPGWCPVAGPQVPGNADREIVLQVGDRVELELTAGVLWYQGRHSFVIVPAGAIDYAKLQPAFGELLLWGAPGARTMRFVADRPGTFQFLDTFNYSGTGKLTIR